jgi:hypothetical protein
MRFCIYPRRLQRVPILIGAQRCRLVRPLCPTSWYLLPKRWSCAISRGRCRDDVWPISWIEKGRNYSGNQSRKRTRPVCGIVGFFFVFCYTWSSDPAVHFFFGGGGWLIHKMMIDGCWSSQRNEDTFLSHSGVECRHSIRTGGKRKIESHDGEICMPRLHKDSKKKQNL